MTPETVSIPQDHAGVGAALRVAFLPRVSNMPNELAELLARLD